MDGLYTWRKDDSELLMKLAMVFQNGEVDVNDLLKEFNDNATEPRSSLRSLEARAYTLAVNLEKSKKGPKVSDALRYMTNQLRAYRRRAKKHPELQTALKDTEMSIETRLHRLEKKVSRLIEIFKSI